jgi:nucleotide-binding universal stress UspA family protein
MPVLLPASHAAAVSGRHVVPDATELRAWEDAARAPFGAAAGELDVAVVVEMGPTVATILEHVSRMPADLIVMGTHGTSGFDHLLLGSVTEKVLRKARCPVLTVPPRAHVTSKLPFERLMCAVDFSDSSLAALENAISLAIEADARLTLLHVLEWPWREPPPPELGEMPEELARRLEGHRREREEHVRARLEALLPESVRTASRPDVLIANGKAHVEVLRAAAEGSADLIVMGVRGHQRLEVLAFGSSVNQVVRRATCPVLTVRS